MDIKNKDTNSLPSGGLGRASVVGVLGAGSMGSGIAQIAATQEHQVVLVDLNDTALAILLFDNLSLLARAGMKGTL